MRNGFSFSRLWGLIVKEFTQFKRDRSTFLMVISMPVVMLILFGLAIDMNPHYLPAALINSDDGVFSRTLIQGMQNTKYFTFNHFPKSEAEAARMMARHEVSFTLNIPPDFSRLLVRGKRPSVLLEVDGTDPVSVGYAMSAATNLLPTVFQYDLIGPLQDLNATNGPVNLIVHTKYNPSAITQYNIVPGLLGLVLTMTFVMVASMALTREREQGTMENLLATPILPVEVIIGKSAPFVLVGYVQVIIVAMLAVWLFKVPLLGSVLLLLILTLPFMLATLFVGIMVSTLAETQLEASQISLFFLLPSFLLSGFAFPFKGMPVWAQWIGNVLPLTHFINITRGIMLKGIGFLDAWTDVWPILVFMFVMLFIALNRYRQTLD